MHGPERRGKDHAHTGKTAAGAETEPQQRWDSPVQERSPTQHTPPPMRPHDATRPRHCGPRVLCQPPGSRASGETSLSFQMLTSAIPRPNEDASRGQGAGYFSLSHAKCSTAGPTSLIYSLLSNCLPCSSDKNIFTWIVIKLKLVYWM